MRETTATRCECGQVIRSVPVTAGRTVFTYCRRCGTRVDTVVESRHTSLLALDHFDDLRFRGAMEALDELLDSRCAIRQKTLAAVRRKVDRTAAELTSPLNRRREQYTAARDRHFPAQTAPTERA